MTRATVDSYLPSIMCCLGYKGFKAVRAEEKGKKCDTSKLKQLIRSFEILKKWYPYGYVIEDRIAPYSVFDVTDALTSITIDVTGYGNLYTGTVNLVAIVAAINADTDTSGFSAEADGTNLWIYAPDGFNGVSLTIGGVGAPNVTVLTTYGEGVPIFICGHPYVVAAEEPCLSDQQVENLLELFKKECGICERESVSEYPSTVPTNIVPAVVVAGCKQNATATRPPSATDDATQGYCALVSFWRDVSLPSPQIAVYQCIDATQNNAVWMIVSYV